MSDLVLGFLVCALGLAFLWLLYVFAEDVTRLKEEAIDRGFAEHDPVTGEWKWKEKLPAQPEEKK